MRTGFAIASQKKNHNWAPPTSPGHEAPVLHRPGGEVWDGDHVDLGQRERDAKELVGPPGGGPELGFRKARKGEEAAVKWGR